MLNKVNNFKSGLKQKQLIGLWLALGEAGVAEVCSQLGFDWILIDGEHGPNDLRSILAQLRAANGTDTSAVVRLASDDRVLIKRHLDIGAQTLLIPMIESAEQAREVVRSCHYAPKGARGVGAGMARASNYGSVTDYIDTAADEICILLQVETRAGIAALDEILAVEHVDGVFVGPSDLAADMGHPGGVMHPEVQKEIVSAIKKINASQKASGILTFGRKLAHSYHDLGVNFIAVGSDVGGLVSALKELRSDFK